MHTTSGANRYATFAPAMYIAPKRCPNEVRHESGPSRPGQLSGAFWVQHPGSGPDCSAGIPNLRAVVPSALMHSNVHLALYDVFEVHNNCLRTAAADYKRLRDPL